MLALGFRQHGDLNCMEILEVKKPEPGPGEVVIAVKASSFNHLDIWVRQGWPGLNLELPHISGSDAAGVIEACGEGVDFCTPGTPVTIDPGICLQADEFT